MTVFDYIIFSITSATVLLIFVVFFIYAKNHFFKGTVYKGVSLVLLILGFRFTTIHLYLNGLITDYPHFLMIDHISSRFGLPVMFLIIYLTIHPRRLKWFDGLHFIIPTFFLINFRDIYFGSSSLKIEILERIYQDGFDVIWGYGSLYSPFWVIFFKYLIHFGYAIAIGYLAIKHRDYDKIPSPILSFFKFTLLFLVTNLLPVLYFSLVQDSPDSWMISSLIGLGSTLILLFAVFLIPDFLFVAKDPEFLEDEFLEEEGQEEEDYLDYISRQAENDLFVKINRFFDSNKPFLDPDFTLMKFEEKVGLSGRYISEAIKDVTGMNFPQYLNQCRINYFKQKCANPEFYQDKTIDELAQQIGYKSVNNFYIHFKKIEGVTPKDFLNSLEQGND